MENENHVIQDNKTKRLGKNIFNIFGGNETKKENKNQKNDKTMWVPDEKAQTCHNCQKQFSAIFLRKHHCRICGNVFCKDCSNKTVDGKYWGTRKEIKVCEYCYEMYKKLDETLVETTIDNPNNYIEDIDSIDDNIKNLKRETKLSEYCKKAKKDLEESNKFLQVEKKHEEPVKQAIDHYYDYFIKTIIEKELREGQLERWFDKIYDLTKKSISQVNPSFKDLKDSLNVNDYIKIKTIQYKDQSLCKVVDGYAFQKNVCSKKMNNNIDNPRILILDCSLDYNRNKDSLTNFENLMMQEPAYFNIIMKKIELVDPNVILVGKNVSRKIQEYLDVSNKISLVMNVKSESLKKIARCTKTYVLPSTDLIDKQTILGTCKKFRIEKIKNCFNSKTDILKSNDQNLMIFEGCDYLLSCTIILSGSDKDELKKLKTRLRTILLTCRDLYLQKFLIYFSFMDIININFSDNRPSNLTNSTDIINSPDYQYLFDSSILDQNKNNRKLYLVKLTMVQGVFNNGLLNAEPGSFSQNYNELAEHEVLKIVHTNCEKAQELDLCYYEQDNYSDKPLGQLILELCSESEQKCEICKKLKQNHIYYIYKKTGRIKINMIQNEDNLEKIMEYINRESSDFSKFNFFSKGDGVVKVGVNYNCDIFSYGFCKKCNKIVTPLAKLPREMFNYSIAKFFKNILFNHKTQNRSKYDFNLLKNFEDYAINTCTDYVNKDINRIFVTKFGSIKFSFENCPIYIIEPSPMNEKRDSKYFNHVLEVYLSNASINSSEVLEYLRINFTYYREEYGRLETFVPDDHKTIIKVSFEKIDKIIYSYLKVIQDIKNFTDNLFQLHRFDDYVKALVYIKNVYFRIVQVKIVFNYVKRLIRKIKSTINFINKMRIIIQTFDKDTNSVNTSGHNLISLDDVFNTEFINIDNKESYKQMLREISYFDENHNKYSSNISEYDISSIIAYTLTSDKYRETISPNNKFKLIDIKCERKEKVLNFDEVLQMTCMNERVTISDQNYNNFGYNYLNRDLEVCDTSLLFDGSKSVYKYQNLDNNKINQQLETELLSDEKFHFNLTSSNLNVISFLTNWKFPIEYEIANENSKFEKLILQGDNIKQTLDEIEKIRIEIRSLKETNKQITDNKTKEKSKKSEFLEENFFTPLECDVIVYYPRQFEALRISYCATYDEFILSIANSAVWSNVSGGKSKADFYKSHDNKYILKCVNKHEFKMFNESSFQYFHHNAKFLFHKMPSALAKILGAYKIKIRNIKTGRIDNNYVILMENLFYGKDEISKNSGIKAYDLKGSKSNRYISKREQKPSHVLPDTNFKEDYRGEPLSLEKNMADLLKAAIHNDSLILSKMNVVDYSLLLIIDENDKEGCAYMNVKTIRVGIIDYVRKYTWDKQLEHVGKIIINRLQVPTIVNPVNYKERFKEAIDDYFIGL